MSPSATPAIPAAQPKIGVHHASRLGLFLGFLTKLGAYAPAIAPLFTSDAHVLALVKGASAADTVLGEVLAQNNLTPELETAGE